MKISKFNFKILSFTMLVILCSNLVCGIILIRFIDQTLHDQIIKDNDRIISETSNRLESYVDDISTFGQVLSMDQQLQALLKQTDSILNTYPYFHDMQEVSEQLKRFTLMMDNYIDDIYIIRDGELPIISGEETRNSQYSANEKWYQNFIASGEWKSFSTEIQTIKARNNKDVEVFHYLQNIYNLQKPKEKLGTLVINLKYKPLQSILEAEAGSEFSYLLMDAGRVIYPRGSLPETLDIQQIWQNSQEQASWSDRGQYYFTRGINKTEWSLVETLPNKVIENKIWQTIILLVLLLLGTLVVVFIIFLLVMYRITHPLKVLASGIDKVAAGDLEVSVDLNTQDELTDIANLFNDMVVKIRLLLAESVSQEKQKQDLKLRLLIAQINPHFICNTLNSVIYRAQSLHEVELAKTIRSFISILQVTMNVEEKICTVRQEVEFINHYVEVLRFRYQFLNPVVWNVDQEVERWRIPRMLIYPLVENSVFHGLLPKREGKIFVTINQESGKIRVCVEDNGVGMSSDKLRNLEEHIQSPQLTQQKRSIGLQNVNQRLQINGGESNSLRIESEEHRGTRMVFHIHGEMPETQQSE